jgi:hypothetical protein
MEKKVMKTENRQVRTERCTDAEVLYLSVEQADDKVQIDKLPAPCRLKPLLHIERTILSSSCPDRAGKKTHYRVFSQKPPAGRRDKRFAERLILEMYFRKDLSLL